MAVIFLTGNLFSLALAYTTSQPTKTCPTDSTQRVIRGGFACRKADNSSVDPILSCPTGSNLSAPGAAQVCIHCPTGQQYDSFNNTCASTVAGGSSVVGATVTPYVLSVNIPCNPIAGGTCKGEGIAGYVARLYQFGLMIVGLIALGGLVFGALKYTLSAGNVVTQQDAKDQILAAIYGLLILLGAYLILATINPDLVNLRNPGAAKIIAVPPAGGTSGGTPGTPQNVLTPPSAAPAPAPSSHWQQPASPGANYPTQTGCARNSNQYVVMINGHDYWACFNPAPGYKNVDGIVSPQ